METRFKLTPVQFDTLAKVNRQVNAAELAFKRAVEALQCVSDVIMDAHGQDVLAESRVDEVTKELVVLTPDPKADTGAKTT
jgi:hypothetical protein